MSRNTTIITKEEGLIYISPRCSLTESPAYDFDHILLETSQKEDKHIVLDFKNVDYLFSRTIGNLVLCHKLQKQKNKEIVIINATEKFCDLWDSINLSQLIPIFHSFKEFLAWTDRVGINGSTTVQTLVAFDKKDGILIVRIETAAGRGMYQDISQKIDDLLGEEEIPRLVIDLKKAGSLDLVLLESLVKASEDIRAKQGRIVVAGADPGIKELFETFNLDGLFEFAGNVKKGIRLLTMRLPV